MRWIKKNLSSIILVLIFIIGLSLLLYPSFSDYWNSFHQSRAIASYAQSVTTIDDDQYEKMWAQAQEYNTTLAKKQNRWVLSEEEYEEYEDLLNIGGTGIIGYIEIPNIKVSLPIYHGVDEAVLQIAVGHFEGSSLPVGGEGTHCVISGHRGLPSAKLFTNLDEMEEGDLFMMRVLDETLTYEVDQIRIVEPEDLSALDIEEGKDLCTLVTCTPYGINSHRLLVRGHRVENLESASSIRVTADAMQIDPVMVAPVIAVPILLILLIWLLVHYRKRR
ncbi:MAG: class C sortase [Lachnospiraceae bacterium]|nr:class C sortase [Lachnospiraceae bacterium]